MTTCSVSVNTPQNPYWVIIGENHSRETLRLLLRNSRQKKLYLVTNEKIFSLYQNFIQELAPEGFKLKTLCLPDGEKYKNTQTLELIYNFLMKNEATRESILIAFGGGVIGDLVGHAAATFMRGIELIQIPTTLLAQVDSSIGGKTGVNHPLGKNSIGSFKQPKQTIIDVNFLNTLPQREFVAGYAELIKHGFIRSEKLFQKLADLSVLELINQTETLIHVIHQSCAIKAKVVENDEKEFGLRAILNFGHTIGHLLETVTEYSQYLHGEVVIAGMDFAVWWSHRYAGLSQSECSKIRRFLFRLGVLIRIVPIPSKNFLKILGRDKKNTSRGIRFIALSSIGTAEIIENTSLKNIEKDFLKYLDCPHALIKII